ncbi:MAG: hypothetical protein MJ252_17650, partial [archaeon]|nr:hypothetical protein [archaeon]
MEEAKFNFFVSKLLKNGILLSSQVKQFVSNYKFLELDPNFKRQSQKNKNLMELFLKNKLSNYLFEYLVKVPREKMQVICMNIYDKLMEANKEEKQFKLHKILSLYSKGHLFHFFREWKAKAHYYNYRYNNYYDDNNYSQNRLVNKFKSMKKGELTQSNSSLCNIKSKSSICLNNLKE